MARKSKPPRLWLEDRGARSGGKQWTILDGGRKIRTGCPESLAGEAEKALAEYITEKHTPVCADRASEIPIADVLLKYRNESVPGHARPEVAKSELRRLEQFWGEKNVADIKKSTTQQYISWKKGFATSKNPMITSTRNELITLRAAINFWAEETPILDKPTIKLPPKPQGRQEWASRNEVAQLLRAVRHREGARHVARFILIGVYTGTRSSAILGLRWVQSLESGWIDVEHGVLYRKGAGKAETKKRQPPIRIHRKLFGHIKRWHALDLAAGISHVVHYQGQGVKKLRRSWPGVRKEAALDQHFVLHGFRHTAATWLMQARVDPWEACGYLGMTLETIQNYAHHHPDYQSGAVNADFKKRSSGNEMGMKRLG
jgi:integrase